MVIWSHHDYRQQINVNNSKKKKKKKKKNSVFCLTGYVDCEYFYILLEHLLLYNLYVLSPFK